MTNNGQIYIQDPTQNNKFIYVNKVNEAVIFLDGMCHRGLNKSRKQLMLEWADLGYGEDDRDGISFLRAMREHVNMGLVKNNRHVNCDITMTNFDKPEYGN